MAKYQISDLSQVLSYNEKTFKYDLANLDWEVDYHIKQIIKKSSNQGVLAIATISEIVNEVYPFVDKQNTEVIQNLINRTRRIKTLVFQAIKNRRGAEFYFEELDEKDKFIIKIAKSIVHDLNKFLYKYEIKQVFSNLILINNDVNNLFVGNIDFLATNGKEWFLGSFKNSRSGFNQKYSAELYLQKQLIESNTNYKINKMFIFNPLEQRVVLEANMLSNYELFKISQTEIKKS
ncbi:hypothetical protein CXP39_00480 [Mesoplasma syrphidae]|uniref:Uncharacterized protein n=1 Tax=Mesoplasma syrphidae TaxID=225999 RepID=A0A2K9BJ05_9MOLU|nr:hypothetical protein [Mesoplasma syrphidae]AUF83286.1 hypothetical protein CXP39_00480 [Mesoplasma syrphidae]